MSNFMGPMAPPPAAPAQPQALDFQTDPNQRQRFKQFMQQRMQPPMPQMPAPMPQPMPTVPAGSYILPDMDIFAPQQFYDGGIVGGLNSLGEMSGQMVEALNQVVYGGDPMGGGMPSAPSGPPSMGGGGFGGGNMPPPLPAIQQPVMNTEPSGPVASIGSGVPTAQPYNHVDASIPSPNVSDGRYVPDLDGRHLEVYPASAIKTIGGNMTPGGPEIDIMGNIAQPTLGGNVGGDFMGSAQNYFGNNIDPRGPVTPMTPEDIFRQAQSRNMQQDVKSPEVQAYLDNIIKTGGRPTMMAPKIDYSNLMSVLPGGGMVAGKPGPGFGSEDEGGLIDPFRNPYSMPGFTPLPPGELGFTENMMGPIQGYAGGPNFDENAPYQFADGGSVSDALADALSNDIGDYSADDTMTDLAQTSYNDLDPGGNESFDAAAMDQFRNQQVSDLSSTLGQQIQNVINSNQQMGTPAPVPQSTIEQMQFENLQNVPTTEPVFSMPSLNLGGKSTSFDLLGNPLTIGFEDGGSVPPRRTEIGGNDHMLSYITPDEADILMALGGSGEDGPMGIPSFNPNEDRANEEAGGFGEDPGFDGGGGGSAQTENVSLNDDSGNDSGFDRSDYRGYTEEDEQQQTRDMQDYEENVFGGDSPDGYSVQDILNANAGISETLGDVYDMNAINRGRQDRMNLQETLDNTLENEIETGKVSTGTAVNDGDIESLDALTNAVESSSKIGGTNTGNNLLGGIDDLLGTLDKTISKVSGPTQSEINALENARNQAGTFAPTSATASTPTVLDDMLALDRNKYSKDVTTDPMVVARAMDAVQPKGLMNVGLVSNALKGLAQITGQYPSDEQIAKDYANRQFGMGVSPGEAIAALGMDKGIKAAGMVGMTPDGQYVDITGDALANAFGPENRTKDDGILSGITGFFNDQLFDAASGSKVAVVDSAAPELANIVGSTTGFGAYTGDNRFDPNRPPEDFGGGGDDNILLPLKPEEVAPEPTDPNQIGGINTPADPLAPAGPVLVPSTRTSTPFSGQMPVGYGSPQTGQINPYALSEMQRYEQLLRQLGQQKSPIGLAQGGSVLDAAAGRFLESLTAA